MEWTSWQLASPKSSNLFGPWRDHGDDSANFEPALDHSGRYACPRGRRCHDTLARAPVRADLDEICALARQRDFDQAEELMVRYLRVYPDNNRAHLLMAQFAMDRPDPQPQRALDHLGRIHGGTTKEAAIVRFSEGKAHYQEKSTTWPRPAGSRRWNSIRSSPRQGGR